MLFHNMFTNLSLEYRKFITQWKFKKITQSYGGQMEPLVRYKSLTWSKQKLQIKMIFDGKPLLNKKIK